MRCLAADGASEMRLVHLSSGRIFRGPARGTSGEAESHRYPIFEFWSLVRGGWALEDRILV